MIVFHVLDPAELDFDFDDPSAFEDLESGEQIPIVPERAARPVREMIQAHIEALRERFSANRIDYTHAEHVGAARSRAVQLSVHARD